MSNSGIDLFNNPMVDAARKALTPEQQEQYKRVGQYMYSEKNWQMVHAAEPYKKEAAEEDILAYAIESIKAGLNPKELTEKELRALCKFYGEKWYEKFDFREDEIKQPMFQMTNKPEIKDKICRQQRRAEERRKKKEKR